MYNFIPDVFRTIAEMSSVIFDLRRQFFADAKIFELERLNLLFWDFCKHHKIKNDLKSVV